MAEQLLLKPKLELLLYNHRREEPTEYPHPIEDAQGPQYYKVEKEGKDKVTQESGPYE